MQQTALKLRLYHLKAGCLHRVHVREYCTYLRVKWWLISIHCYRSGMADSTPGDSVDIKKPGVVQQFFKRLGEVCTYHVVIQISFVLSQ